MQPTSVVKINSILSVYPRDFSTDITLPTASSSAAVIPAKKTNHRRHCLLLRLLAHYRFSGKALAFLFNENRVTCRPCSFIYFLNIFFKIYIYSLLSFQHHKLKNSCQVLTPDVSPTVVTEPRSYVKAEVAVLGSRL